jgi:hypothetical protein
MRVNWEALAKRPLSPRERVGVRGSKEITLLF